MTGRSACVCAVAYVVGAIPFSNLVARARAGVDLRDVESGTVSGTALYGVAGFAPLAVAGVCDVAKGAVGPLIAGAETPALGAAAASAAVVGHNWSPFLRGAGGRGISVAMGALAVRHWPGTVVLAIGLAAGRLARQTGLGSFLAELAVVPVLTRTQGWRAGLAGSAVVVPMLLKRCLGNRLPANPTPSAYVHRLVFDHDPEAAP